MHSFSQLFVFGDSLSDCGRTMENLQLDPGQLGGSYYQYRYSDGPIYLDQLCLRLGLPSPNVTNVFARGSATTDSGWCQGISDLTGEPVPGVVQQVAAYLSERAGCADPDACHIVWVGINDYYFHLVDKRMPEAKSVADRIEVAVRMLRTAGARDVVVGLMIGLHTFPGFQAMCPGDLPALEAASLELNGNLCARLPQLGCRVFDVNPALAAFERCHGPGSQFIWDQWHLTTQAHAVVADVIMDTVS